MTAVPPKRRSPRTANRGATARFGDFIEDFRASWRAPAHRELRKRFPDIFSLLCDEPTLVSGDVTIKAYGIEYPRGWHRLVVRLAASITNLTPPDARPTCVQVKEKFGELRFYLADEAPDEVLATINTAKEESQRTCQECGRPGQVRDIGSWLSTLCGRHFLRKRLSRLKPR